MAAKPVWSSPVPEPSPEGSGDPEEEQGLISPQPPGPLGIEGEVGSASIGAPVLLPQIPGLTDQGAF